MSEEKTDVQALYNDAKSNWSLASDVKVRYFLFFPHILRLALLRKKEIVEKPKTPPELSEKSIGTYTKTFERVSQCIERFGEPCWKDASEFG